MKTLKEYIAGSCLCLSLINGCDMTEIKINCNMFNNMSNTTQTDINMNILNMIETLSERKEILKKPNIFAIIFKKSTNCHINIEGLQNSAMIRPVNTFLIPIDYVHQTANVVIVNESKDNIL